MKKITICILTLATVLPTIALAQSYSPYPKVCYSMWGPGTTLSETMKSRFSATADPGGFESLSALGIRTEITEHRTAQCQKMAAGAEFDDKCPAGLSMDVNDHAALLLEQHGSKSKTELKPVIGNFVTSYQSAARTMNEACEK